MLDKLLLDYKKAVLWEQMSSRGNNCMEAMRAELAVEAAEKALKEFLS